MKELSPAGSPGRLFSLKFKLGIINYGVLGFFLFFSEFLNAIFNNTLDAKGFPLSQRFAFAFKPAVVALYLLFATILYLIVLKFLRPLFRYLKEREEYQQARTSAIRIPWTILLFQVGTWALGTTVYYAMYGFVAESGIPYVFGLLLKVAVGTMAGMYSAILINIVLMSAKRNLLFRRSGKESTTAFRGSGIPWWCWSPPFISWSLSRISPTILPTGAAQTVRGWAFTGLCSACAL